MSYFQTDNYDELFKYFFDVYTIAFTKGLATDEFENIRQQIPNLNVDHDKRVSFFLGEGLSLLREAYTPNVLALLLDHLCIEFLGTGISVEQLQIINLSKYLIKSLYAFDISEFLFMARFWSKQTKIYAEEHFYPSLPIDIQEKYLHRHY